MATAKSTFGFWIALPIGCVILIELLTFRRDDGNSQYVSYPSFDRPKIKTNIIRFETQLVTAETTQKLPVKLYNLTSFSSGTPSQEGVCIKQILYWNGPKMKLPDGKYYCPEVNCEVKFTSKASYDALPTGHAVILHHTGNWQIQLLERYRPKGQMWIYMSRESPPHSRHGRVPNVFNWTMTYRSDSDFPISYGIYKSYDEVSQKPSDLKNRNKNWAHGKTKLAAWISSNCKGPSWPRALFVKNLSRHMDVDMFGKCGDKKCPPGEACYELLRSYKFYLAFENSRCSDYITEKMWRNAFIYNLVPVVYGTSKKDYERLAPPNSFIHVSDFPNITSLVAYIQLLNQNDSMYNKYFEWKYSSYIDQQREDKVITKETLCSIAAKLRDCTLGSRNSHSNCSNLHTSLDMNKMWFDTCHESTSLPLPV